MMIGMKKKKRTSELRGHFAKIVDFSSKKNFKKRK